MSHTKGDRRERELVRLLSGEHEHSPYDEGQWAVMRAPASGAATERELPDVFAGNGGVFWAIEAKASGGSPIYIAEEEIDGLEYFSSFWGAYARIGVRFDAKPGDPHYANDDDSGWRFFAPNDLYRTGENNARVKKEEMSEGITLEDLWNDPLN